MKCLCITFLLLLNIPISSQQLFYRDIYKGGVAVRMFSSNFSSISSTKIDFPIGSSIKKAFLIAGNVFDSHNSTQLKSN